MFILAAFLTILKDSGRYKIFVWKETQILVITSPVFSLSIVEQNMHVQCHACHELIPLVAQSSQVKSENNDRIEQLILFEGVM